MKSAREVYEKLVAAIDRATADRHIYDVPKAAEAEGMAGGEIRRDLSQRWEYTYADHAGGTVKVDCYWYDQSKPFSIRPDMHKMRVELEDANGKLVHANSYEE